MAISQDTLNHYFELLEETLTQVTHEPGRIYNCEESGFSGKLNPSKKVIVPKGTRHQSIVNIYGHISVRSDTTTNVYV